jgi:hypothetical protein
VIRETGETRCGEGSGLDADIGRRLRRESDVIAYMAENNQVSVTDIFYGGRDYEALYRGIKGTRKDQNE